jgi:TolB-like protein/Tfp pilus assembly protein PilF
MSEDSASQTIPGRDVFVSYASQDVAVANSVVENLEQQGTRCWIAPRDVTPGSQYADEIVGAINDAKIVVLVLSENAVASPHVGKEIERASSKRRRIIAFRTDAAALTRSFEYFLSESQWIDVAALGMPGALAKLTQAVGQALSSPSAPKPEAGIGGISGQPMAVHPTGMGKRLALVAAAVVVLGIAISLAVRFWPLKGQAPTVAAVSDKSIAVLPFTDMSQKKDQEYFGDGMAEEILDLLAKIPGLTVIGRTSSFQFKGKNEDLRKIGTELNAAYVLEGSVRNSGDQVRITAQLINTRTGAHEWSETYDRPIGDVLRLQDAIAAAVVRELQLTVDPEHLQSRPTLKSARAYDLVLRGRHAADRGDQSGYDEAIRLFQQSLALDPASADAEANLAQTYASQAIDGFLPPLAGAEQARRAATNALNRDPTNVLAHVVLAQIHLQYDWDWAGAERELQRAATLPPGNVDLPIIEAVLSSVLGRSDDALKQIKAALVQDPMNPDALITLSNIQEGRGHFSEAEAATRRALDIRPSYDYGHYNLGFLLLERGERDGALAEMQRESTDDAKQEGLALVYFALGKKTEADATLTKMIKEKADGNALGIAEVYAFRGQSDDAMHWLERAYTQKESQLFGVKVDLLLKNLQTDPRYRAFLRKMNLPE